MVHRGPDAAGVWSDPERGVFLGHRRLAIVDLSEHGKQPMSFAGGRLQITFNGEIYNFRDLSRELESRGYRFTSTGDTQVLLAAVAEWGLHPALQRMAGMFAFAIWDRATGTLHLARDRMGEKPLHFGVIAGNLYFASEIRAFGAIPQFSRKISQEAISSYLRFGYVPEPFSIYQGIYKLPPGTTLSIPARGDVRLNDDIYRWTGRNSSGIEGIAPSAYWSCEEAAIAGCQNLISDPREASAELEERLRSTVRQQMLCDVPIGCFLSGGIDSSLVAAVMQAESGSPVHTFTVSFDNPEFDESKQARAIAEHLGTRHEEFVLTQSDVVKSVPSLISTLDEPTANGSFFAVQQISKLARTRATVVLSGDGGDELFAGYNRYALTSKAWAKLHLLPGPIRAVLRGMLSCIDYREFSNKRGYLTSLLSLGSQASVGSALAKAERLLEARDYRECYDLVTSCWPSSSNLVSRSQRERIWREPPGLGAMLLSDQLDYLPGDSLAKVDRASMAVSLETRLPLLDHRIVEFSWRVPENMKLREGNSKWLMRSVLDHFVPAELTVRRKMGFTVPVDQWLTGSLRSWARDALGSRQFAETMGDRYSTVIEMWNSYQRMGRPVGYQMWALVTLAGWLSEVRLAQN